MERRLAAILFADIVGYSRLMHRDEAGTLASVNAMRDELLTPLLATHGGRLVKSTGDGFLIEFPSAVGAVSAALAWQARLRGNPLQLRIGINVGDVIVEGTDLYGDGVNVAARLEQSADPGAILVSQAAYDHVSGRIALQAQDLGETTLRNIDTPLRVWRLSAAAGPEAKATSGMSQVLAATQALGLPPHPVIAVLPFVNMSSDAEQAFFADGLSEDIITRLAHLRGLVVIARTSSFAFRDSATQVQEVARQLGASHVLEGSVRKAGSRVRVTAQLIDGSNGAHLWAQRYDRDLTDIFTIQDEITHAITLAMQIHLTDGEAIENPGGTTDYAAWEAFNQAVQAHLVYTAEDNLRARRLYVRAAELDPGFADARIFHAWTHWQHARSGFSADPAADFAFCREVVDRLRAEGPETANLVHLDAVTHLMLGDYDAALATAAQAVRMAPSRLFGFIPAAIVYTYSGRYDAAVEVLRRTIRAMPATPADSIYNLANVSALTGDHALSTALAEEYARRVPKDLYAYTTLAVAHGLAGESDRAREAVAHLRSEFPDYTLAAFAAHEPFRDAGELRRVTAVLEAAGLSN